MFQSDPEIMVQLNFVNWKCLGLEVLFLINDRVVGTKIFTCNPQNDYISIFFFQTLVLDA